MIMPRAKTAVVAHTVSLVQKTILIIARLQALENEDIVSESQDLSTKPTQIRRKLHLPKAQYIGGEVQWRYLEAVIQ